jgi:hypothetical protein
MSGNPHTVSEKAMFVSGKHNLVERKATGLIGDSYAF